jgi:hypothetical protein
LQQRRDGGRKLSEEITGQGLPLPNPVYEPRPRVPFEMLLCRIPDDRDRWLPREARLEQAAIGSKGRG